MEIVGRNSETEYGREYGFSSIRTFEDYRARVPVVDYDGIRERIDRIVAGAKNVLTAEDPVMFAQTSGTTGDAKYIPVTPTCQGRDHSDPMRTWSFHAASKHPGIFRGKLISMVSPAVEGVTESGLPYGSTSGHIYQNMPRLVRSAYAIPYEVFLITDYEAKYYALMRVALGCDVSLVGTANPSSVLQLVEYANEHAGDLLKDLADGTLKRDLDIEPELRPVIESRLTRDPEKGRFLDKARILRSGKLLPADYWPHLALIGCWKGGTVGSYIKKFPQWFDPDEDGMVPVRDWGYLSSEARGSIPLSDQGSAGVLTIGTNVFEFVPVENLEDNPHEPESWEFHGVDEIEAGHEYYVFFTTTGGLYRYDINDVVEVVGRYNRTPTIVFKRKGRGMTNLTGEKLSVNQVIAAFESASERLGVTIDHFKAEADIERSRYVFKIEAPALSESLRRPLLEELDRGLGALNIEYQAKRKSLRLKDPLLWVMKAGWYEREKKALVASGKRLFQAKTILLDSKDGFKDDPENREVVVSLGDDI